MKWYVILLVILIFFGGYLYISSEAGDVTPLGRLAFVKLANPDMYPGHQHSELLAQYAQDRGSKCAIVAHYKGTSRYLSYNENGVYIIEMAFESSPSTTIDWGQVLQYFLFGVPDDEWKIMVNGKEFDNYDDAWAEVMREAEAHGQQGPIPMVWHGTARAGSAIINPGCGFPLYYYVCWKQYGRFAAYYYVLSGEIFPYLNSPYRNFELQHASELQYYYTHNMLNYE
ncbi:hypothetical protein [Methanobacterium aggregans]|uniref:hypothetical protein n=1 Tax=Methanobacterium aggregans TaxID=1615586 RepID=UPI001AE7B40B|nr:hypothetical protein [Methanobacterium aggregans]MBP2046307.1 hypothetical protein [Methanobacterium aggregans]